jgi:hypothetical protein
MKEWPGRKKTTSRNTNWRFGRMTRSWDSYEAVDDRKKLLVLRTVRVSFTVISTGYRCTKGDTHKGFGDEPESPGSFPGCCGLVRGMGIDQSGVC